MKAKELAEIYRKDRDEKGEDQAITNLIKYLFENVVAVTHSRGSTPGALSAAWKEANQKWKSIAYNYPEFYLKPDGFEKYTESENMKPQYGMFRSDRK